MRNKKKADVLSYKRHKQRVLLRITKHFDVTHFQLKLLVTCIPCLIKKHDRVDFVTIIQRVSFLLTWRIGRK